MHRHCASLLPVVVVLGALAAMLLGVRPGGPILDWLRDPANSSPAQAISSVVQAFFAVALFVTTIVTIRLTRRTAQATDAAAAATRDAVVEAGKAREQAQEQHAVAMAESARQRLDTVRPILLAEMLVHSVTEVRSKPHAVAFRLRNVGSGPALDVLVRVEEPAVAYEWSPRWQRGDVPAVVPAGDRELRYGLDANSQAMSALPEKVVPRLAALTAAYTDLHRRHFATVYALNLLGSHGVIGERRDRDDGADFRAARFVLPGLVANAPAGQAVRSGVVCDRAM